MNTDNDNTGKFKGRYRISSPRWAAWDYGRNAAYFVTVCIANRAPLFGAVTHGQMHRTPLGQSADDCWQAIPAHFPFVELDAFVVMPNHVHGIVVINKPDGNDDAVETQDLASLPTTPKNKFGPQSQNLASIIRGYKIGVTKYARQNGLAFTWQARYHDHVIRNQAELTRIQHYILTNPQQWEQDQFYALHTQ